MLRPVLALALLPLAALVNWPYAEAGVEPAGNSALDDTAGPGAGPEPLEDASPDPPEYAGTEPLEDVDAVEEVLVIGTYRRSLREALMEKRGATEIIEALSAEDIGQLPDTSVAESLARLPGLSYTRNAFGANNLSIRGLGAVLTNGTLNDRDLASEWGDRSVSFNLFPAELITRASVYKAPSASHVEGGIGGTVNLQTARPLNWGERALAVNFRTRYNDLAGDLPGGKSFGYRGSVTWVDQFAEETFGVALGYAGQYAPLVSADSYIHESRTVEFGGFIEGLPPGSGPTNDFNIPYGAEQSVFNGTSDRHSALATVQWKPSDALEIHADGFYSTFEQGNTAVGLALGGLGSFGNVYSDVKADGFNLLGATVTCARAVANDCPERGYGQDLAAMNAIDDAESDLQSFGLRAEWTGNALSLSADLSFSKADGTNSWETVSHRPYNDTGVSLEPVRPTASFGENDKGAAFLHSPLDFADPGMARVDALRLIAGRRKDEILSFKLDASYAFDASPVTAVNAGLRLVNRNNVLVRRDARVQPGETAPVALRPEFIAGVYDQADADSAFSSNPVLILDTRRIRDTVFAGVEAAILPSSGHVIDEDVLAWYAQLDFDTTLLGFPAFGNFGVRVVRTDVDTEGASSVEGVHFPIETSDGYTEALPSANVNIRVRENLVVRLAASRVLARPAVNFLSPGTDAYGDRIFGGAGGGGNPYLRPFIASQYDLSVERYFGDDSAFVLALFYKDMETFITQHAILSGAPENTISFIPANGEGGGIFGVEATLQHTFAGLLPEELGAVSIYATWTVTDSNIRLTETFNSGVFGLDGQSDHAGNLTLSWYRGRTGARVSFRYRSEFTRPQRPARAFTTNRGEGDLSFQVSFDPAEGLRLFVEGWGLLNEPRDNFYGLESLQGHYGLFGRNFQFGITWRM